MGRCTRGDARQDPFHLRQTACQVQGVLIFYGDDLVDDVQIEDFGDKARAYTLNAVWSDGEPRGWPGS